MMITMLLKNILKMIKIFHNNNKKGGGGAVAVPSRRISHRCSDERFLFFFHFDSQKIVQMSNLFLELFIQTCNDHMNVKLFIFQW